MIICCGEALIDMIPTADSQGAFALLPKSGGAVFNTAIALGRLAVPSGFISGLSTDLFGRQLQADLQHSQVDTRWAIQSDAPTTLAFVELNNGQASYTFYDENTAGRSLSPDALPEISADASALFFGGISLISEPAADFYAALLARESQDKVIVCDPNIRTGFIHDEQRYRARLEGIIARTDILKVSDEDLDWIIRGDADQDDKIRQLAAQGPRLILLTKGSEGSAAYLNGEQRATAAVQKVEVADTVGAGDTFNAGVMAHLFNHSLLKKDSLGTITDEQLAAALAHGAKVAAITVSRSGANPPWLNEL